MRRLRTIALAGGVFALLSAGVAFAHHSYTRFDMNKSVTLDGVVKEFQWQNPHVWIHVTAKDSVSGGEGEWWLESDSPNMLSRRGWSRRTLKAGDRIVAVVHPEKISTPNETRAALASMQVNGAPIGEALK